MEIEVDYEDVCDEDYFGNNAIWPIKFTAISTDKTAFDALVDKIIHYL